MGSEMIGESIQFWLIKVGRDLLAHPTLAQWYGELTMKRPGSEQIASCCLC
jgi:hypothetical protein